MSRFMKRINGKSREGDDDSAGQNPWDKVPEIQAGQIILHPGESALDARATSLVAIDSEGTMWAISESVTNDLRQSLEDAPKVTVESMLNAYNRSTPKDRFDAGEGYDGLLNFAASFKAIQALEGDGEVKVMPSRLAEALNARDLARHGPPPK